MEYFEIFLVALGLSADACAVSMCVGAGGFAGDLRSRLRLAWHFGLFQFFMPVLGWLLGTVLITWISAVDHWVAFLLLSFVGVRMMRAAFFPEEVRMQKNPTKGSMLVLLSVATSIDAFAVGLSLALVDISIWQPSIMIGITTAITSYISIRLGTGLHRMYGRVAEGLGGVVLVFIGVRIVLSHLQVL